MHKNLIYSVSDEEFLKIVRESSSLSEIAKKLGFSTKPGSDSKKRIRERIQKLDSTLNLYKRNISDKSKRSIINSNKERRVFTEKKCKCCGKTLEHKNSSGYCRKCLTEINQENKINDWLTTGKTGNTCVGNTIRGCIRDYIYESQNNRCAICGIEREWNGKKLNFILDHINGDASNDSRENLRLICPNCDSQLDTYMSKNKNSARRMRYKK